MNRYSQLLHQLFHLKCAHQVKLGLDHMTLLDDLLGRPSRKFHVVHIAGTNGKGSVCAKIAKGLQGRYSKVGLYISPHISTFRERIQLNEEMISEECVLRHLSNILAEAEKRLIPATFFELTTLLAFKYFAENRVDIAVIETGLGGRLDATNIVHPLLSVITSIDFDHMDQLGNSLEAIAREKAGIVKPGIPIILGPTASQVPTPPDQPVIHVSGSFPSVEEENRAIAKAALQFLRIPERQIRKALTTKLPCRKQVLYRGQQEIILDAAHNPAAIKRLFSELKRPKSSMRAIVAISKTKDLNTCLSLISQHASHYHLVEAPNGRSAKADALKEILLSQGVPQDAIATHQSVKEGMESALQLASISGQTIVALGTFFIMSAIKKALGEKVEEDLVDLNEQFPSGVYASSYGHPALLFL